MPGLTPTPTPTPKRGRGRPPGSRNKVWKNQSSVRRTTRAGGTPAPTGQEDIEDNHVSPSLGASSDNHHAWEAERQELKTRVAELEAALAQTLEESAAQAQNAADVINDNKLEIEALQDRIEKLREDKIAYLRRAAEAEEREAQLKERIAILQCGQPWPGPSAGPSRDEAPEAGQSRAAARDRDVAVVPGPSQRASGAAAAPRERGAGHTGRNAWSHEDEELLVRLIADVGERHKVPAYSKIEEIWSKNFPDRIPRDQGQLKDKAWNIKDHILRNALPLPPKFDSVGIRRKVRDDLIVAGINPDRRESDVDENFNPTNVRLI